MKTENKNIFLRVSYGLTHFFFNFNKQENRKIKFLLIGLGILLFIVNVIFFAVFFNASLVVPILNASASSENWTADDFNISDMQVGDRKLITEGKYAGKYFVFLKKGYEVNSGEVTTENFEVEKEQ